jgi:hypothetical protein
MLVPTSPLMSTTRARTWTGLREAAAEPHLRGALLTVLTTSTLCAPLMTFAPVLVRDVFHGNAGQFSAAIGSFGVGGLAGAVLLLAIPPWLDRRLLSSWCGGGYGVVVALVASSETTTP